MVNIKTYYLGLLTIKTKKPVLKRLQIMNSFNDNYYVLTSIENMYLINISLDEFMRMVLYRDQSLVVTSITIHDS